MAAEKDHAELNRLMGHYYAVFAPIGEFERFLVEMMVQAVWSLTKMQQLESCGKIASFDAKPAQRSYRRAHRELTRIRKHPLPLGPSELKTFGGIPIQPYFPDLGDFALRS